MKQHYPPAISKSIFLSFCILFSLCYCSNSFAQFTSGNLVLTRVGDGTTTLSSVAFPVNLVQITKAGTAVNTTALPTTTSGSNFRLTASGISTAELGLNLSVDGRYLTMTGYDAATGTTAVSTTAGLNRVIARIDKAAVINTTTILQSTTGNAYISNSIRSAVSYDGTQFWTSGNGTTASGGTRYTTLGNTTGGGTQISTTTTNTRWVNIFNGQLYTTAASAALQSVSLVGTGLPTTAGQTTVQQAGLPVAGGNPYAFLFLDRNGAVPGVDQLYVADQTLGILKYSWDGVTWTARGSITGNISGLVGYYSCTNSRVELYVTSGTGAANTVYKFIDLAAATSNITSSGTDITTSGTLLATASANTAFRGLAFTPGTSINVPSAFTVTGGGNYCSGGSGVAIGLSNSETGINYQLFEGVNPVGSSVPGTGTALSLGNQTAAGTYTVVATNPLTGCSTNMTGTTTVSLITRPTSVVIGGGNVCSGAALPNVYITLTGASPWNITYTNGTGSTTITGTSTNPYIITGATAGTYTVTVLSDANNCMAQTTDKTGSAVVAVNPLPNVNTVSNQTLCVNFPTTAVNFSGSSGNTVYNWVNNTPSIGLAASGTGNIGSFIAANTGNIPVTATITVTPVSNSFAYIANLNSNNVSVINRATNSVSTTIAVGTAPYALSVSPDNSKVYVSNYSSNNVSVINTATNTVSATIAVGTGPTGIIVSPNGSSLYVSNYINNTVSVINTVLNTVIATIGVGNFPYGISISPDGSRVYVVNISGNSVSVINTAINTVISTIAVGDFPEAVIVSPDGSKAYVCNTNGNSISVINTVTNTISSTISVSEGPTIPTLSPDGSKLYVSHYFGNTVSVINTTTNAVTANIAVNSPFGISVSPDGSKLYVCNTQSNTVSVINTASNSVVSTIPVGVNPFSFGNFLSGTGCAGTPINFTITVNPSPTISFTGLPVSICSNAAAVTLVGSPSGGTFSGTGISGNTFNPATAGAGGPYSITYTYTSGNGCTNVATQAVTVNPLPTVSFTGLPATICANAAAVTLTGSPLGGIFSGTGISGNTFNPATAGAGGPYSITYTYANGNGCANTTTQLVTVNPLPTVSFSGLSTNICLNAAPVTLVGSPLGGTFSGTGISGNIFNSATAGVGGPYTITYSYTNITTGCSNTYTQQVIVNAIPTVTLTAPASVCTGAAATLTLNFTGPGPWNYSINGEATVNSSSNPEIILVSPVATTTYNVTLLSNANCSGSEWASISTGSYHSLGIKTNGTLWAWGNNAFGELGDGSFTDRNKPVQIGSSANWAKIATGAVHSFAIKTDGTLWAWGRNYNGQLGTGDNSNRNVPVQIGNSTDWAKIDGGHLYSLAIKTNGTLWGWGDYYPNSPLQIDVATNWVNVSGGFDHSLGIKSDGTLWGWGNNSVGEIGGGVGSSVPYQVGTSTDWATIFAGQYYSLGIKTNGTLWGWGWNRFGELGIGNSLQTNSPTQVGTATNWAKVSGNSAHSMGIRQDGTLWSWGLNTYGQLGDGTTNSTNTPAQVGTAINWTDISEGANDSHAFRTGGTLWGWGWNQYGQLGDESNTDKTSPVQVNRIFATVTITVNPLPTVSFTGLLASICSNAAVVALVGSPSGGTFSGVGISGNTFNPATAGVGGPYTITYTYTNGSGCTNSAAQTVTVNSIPVVSFTGLSSSICANVPAVTLTGSPSGGTFSGAGISGNTFNPATAGVGGPYTITYTYTNGSGCTNTIAHTVTVNAIPVVSFTGLPSSICANASAVTLTGTPSGGTFSGAGISGNTFNPATAGTGGPYTITYTYTNGSGCTNTITHNITVNAIPVVNFTGLPSSICANASAVTLTGSPSGGTFSGTGISGNAFNPATAGVGGPYTITYTYTSGNGCSNTAIQAVTVNPLPSVSFTGLPVSICSNAAAVTLVGSPSGGTFGGTGVSGNAFNPGVAGAGGPYIITYTYSNGTCSNTSSQTVTVNNCNTSITLNIKMLLQGYYLDAGLMQPVLNNQTVTNSLVTETDSVTIELHHAVSFALVDSKQAVLLTNGLVSATFAQPSGSYYIGIKHRNSIQTWSAAQVACAISTPLYDFTTAADKAMGDNQVEVQTGKWAFYTGDLNQDDFIDGNDFPPFDTDSFNGVNSEYVATDMNGDGFVDANDFPVLDINSYNGVTAIHP